MNDIAGIPYVEARFNKDGVLENEISLPADVTDIALISHGWNNDAEAARELYRRFFENFVAVGQPSDLAGRRFAILGVIWPSKKLDDLMAFSGAPGGAYGAASLNVANTRLDELLEQKFQEMKTFFTEPAQQEILDEAKVLLTDIDYEPAARRKFVNTIRSLIDPTAASRGDASDIFLEEDGDELMRRLGFNSGSKGAAMNILNYATYFEMKTRAGSVGKNGVAYRQNRSPG